MTLRAVFLDIGNTLLREKTSRFDIYARAAEGIGVSVSPERMRDLMKRAHRELPLEIDGAYRYCDPWFRAFIQRIFGVELGVDAGTVAALTEQLFATFEDPATFELFPGARELLRTSREAGLETAVISNWSARLPRLLRALDLWASFDFVLCSAIEGMEKPQPEIFQRALELAGVRAEQALHAGDHLIYDVQGARAVGIDVFRIDHTSGPGDEPTADGIRTGDLSALRSYILMRMENLA